MAAIIETEEATATEPANAELHTVPTPDEMQQMAKTAPYCLAINLKTNQACEARLLPDGYAYRPYTSAKAADWQWLRDTDFNENFHSVNIVDGAEIAKDFARLARIASGYKFRFKAAMKAMGAKSRARLGNKILKDITE